MSEKEDSQANNDDEERSRCGPRKEKAEGKAYPYGEGKRSTHATVSVLMPGALPRPLPTEGLPGLPAWINGFLLKLSFREGVQ